MLCILETFNIGVFELRLSHRMWAQVLVSLDREIKYKAMTFLFYETWNFLMVRFLLLLLSCRYIDQGRNPQLYTKDCLEKAQEKNQQVNGKIDAYKVSSLFFAPTMIQSNNCLLLTVWQYIVHQNVMSLIVLIFFWSGFQVTLSGWTFKTISKGNWRISANKTEAIKALKKLYIYMLL